MRGRWNRRSATLTCSKRQLRNGWAKKRSCVFTMNSDECTGATSARCRNGLGPWFTTERFNAATDAERLGLDILSEGTAVFFQATNYHRDDSGLSKRDFPETREQRTFYIYRMIVYEGGYWMVRDVLANYGERGLVWLIRHPFVPGENMRAFAVAYRRQALTELSR